MGVLLYSLTAFVIMRIAEISTSWFRAISFESRRSMYKMKSKIIQQHVSQNADMNAFTCGSHFCSTRSVTRLTDTMNKIVEDNVGKASTTLVSNSLRHMVYTSNHLLGWVGLGTVTCEGKGMR